MHVPRYPIIVHYVANVYPVICIKLVKLIVKTILPVRIYIPKNFTCQLIVKIGENCVT